MRRSILLLICCSYAFGQKQVPDFQGENASDGKVIALHDYNQAPGVVVIFASNDCPYDGYYIDRIKSIVSAKGQRIPFLIVNSHSEDAENVEGMKAKANSWGAVPYLADKQQRIMDALGARKSPEAFVLQNAGGKFVIVYSGPLDDNPQMADDVKQPYLQAAIDRLLGGDVTAVNVRSAAGCTMRRP